MDQEYALKRFTPLDSPQTSAARSLGKSKKTAIWVALVLVFVLAVLAVEIELLHSGVLVVVMPE